jgi:glycosyltransferase involved in cell wall biosynthesis
LKILHVISSLNPEGGGPAETLRQFTPELIKLGHDVTAVTLDSPDAAWINSFPGNVIALGPGKSSYQYTADLVPWLKKNVSQFDAVVVRAIWQYHSFAVWKALRGSRIPYVVFTHGMLDPWFKKQYPLKHLKKWLYWPWAEYRVLRDARAVLFSSEEECRLARESFWLYRCTEQVVNYGTSAPPGDSEQQKEVFYSAFPETRNKRVFLYLSRIHPKKGCDLLINAFASVAKKDETLHLVMAGPDQTGIKTELEKMANQAGIENRITWTGMISGDLKWGAYHSAEVFVLPSHQENFGIVVAEALACGVPALISNKVNIWQEVLADKAGIVADDTLEGTKILLNSWLDLPAEIQKEYSRQAIQTFQTRFEIQQAAKSLVKVLDDII